MKNGRGFTLVELLVAITVLAIVAVMGWRGLDGIVRSRAQLTRNMEETRGIQLTFAQLQSDLEQIADKKLLRERQNILADNTRLVFVRTVLHENAASQLQVISYSIRAGVLARRESAYTRDLVQLDALWQAALNDAPAGPDAVALQGGVAAMSVRVWEAGGWKPVQNSSTALASMAAGGGETRCVEAEAGSGACQGQGPGTGAVIGGAGAGPGAGAGAGGGGGGGGGGRGPGGGFGPKIGTAPAAEGPTGLEISLQLNGQPALLTKVFLLGAV